jgi:hypothetical protein
MRRLSFVFPAIILLCSFTLLGGCSGVEVNRYAGQQPEFSLFDYFRGTTRGWGMVQNRSGEVLRRFVVDIQGSLNPAGELVLEEDFSWSAGESSRRVWTIGREQDGSYSGRAADVIGTARGQSAGNALNWNYLLDLEVDGKTWAIRFDDWMFLQPDQVLINRATMTKFGFRVGEITITFAKPG